jgi:hypothetical protein
MTEFVERKISESHAKLRDVHKQIEALHLHAASIEGELRAYEAVKNEMENDLSPLHSGTARGKKGDPARNETKEIPSATTRLRKSRLSPLWQAAFTEMVSVYPETVSRKRIEEIALGFGPLSDSFRTSLWHHINRKYIEDMGSGFFRATEVTAYRAGIPWAGEKMQSNELSGATESPHSHG